MIKVILLFIGCSLWLLPVLGQTVMDYDGNEYQTIAIGDQVWMAENLKSLHYSDGTEIADLRKYENNDSLANIYGLLYTWVAAMNGASATDAIPSNVQGACPVGWHLPSQSEWEILVDFLGGAEVAGGKMKETGTLHWQAPNTGATNESGFTALPGGYVFFVDDFQVLGLTGFWRSTTQSVFNETTFRRTLSLSHATAYAEFIGNSADDFACAIRCLKDVVSSNTVPAFKTPLMVYPNPATERITIAFEMHTEATVMIYDYNGRLVLREMLSGPQHSIDIAFLPAGMYAIKVLHREGTIWSRVVKR